MVSCFELYSDGEFSVFRYLEQRLSVYHKLISFINTSLNVGHVTAVLLLPEVIIKRMG
jgi:hypothetical protein